MGKSKKRSHYSSKKAIVDDQVETRGRHGSSSIKAIRTYADVEPESEEECM